MTNDCGLYIGVDIGGTNLRVALVNREGQILQRRKTCSDIGKGGDAFIDSLVSEVSALCSLAENAGNSVCGIGIGVPGLVGSDGLIHSSVNMQPLEGLNLAAHVEERTGIRTCSANDANVIALGEQRFGAGRGVDSCLVITIGTGLGSGLILDGKLWTGSGGFAAEFGHVTVHPEGLLCPCGNRGCLEQYVSAGALVRYLSERKQETAALSLTAEEVGRLARTGDAAALHAFEQIGYWLGIAFASLSNTLNIPKIVIGGGVSESYDLLLPPLKRNFEQRCFRQIYDGVGIEKAQLGDDAGLFGAVSLVSCL